MTCGMNKNGGIGCEKWPEGRLSVIAQRWNCNLDNEEDEDDTHDPPAPIEDAGTSNVGSPTSLILRKRLQ
ncbi:hypothetical protein RclHR1_03360008 [Rhizophagus clarus]|uniref:Uncharacterized protein n=1 Tax=Rhizophagus clarus TaxID=94130 RepID=A0A2Z6RQV1_9GLOM|nr:hypothetical protein RclHR1_03360008 [Rhizophagus clarus]GES95808.1 hypothetical protein RCL_jg28031.t1 [Rhizophagus clarus]